VSQLPPRRPWRCSAAACSDISIAERRSRKHDVGADREPEGVMLTIGISMNTLRTAVIITMSEATKPKFTAHISSGYDKTLKILPHDHTAKCKILSQAQGHGSA